MHTGLIFVFYYGFKRLGSGVGKTRNKVTCERELSALNMSKKTKQVKVMVVSRGVISLSCSCKAQDGDDKKMRTGRREGGRAGSGQGGRDLSPEDEERPADDDEG